MQKQKKISLSLLAFIMASSGVVYAQSDNVEVQKSNEVSKGNTFEREITPLLREISRKKTQLELRKLDRELEKMDEESLKSQMSLDALLSGGGGKSGSSPFGQNKPSSPPPGLPSIPNLSAMPQTAPNIDPSLPNSVPSNLGTATNPIEGNSDIKVLMIYGFDDNLHAKVLSGEQGGYVVKKGDVMPNGQIVHNITANYIEVRKGSVKSKGPIQRIFVSSSIPTATIAQPSVSAPNVGGSASSVRMRTSPQAEANENAAASALRTMPSRGNPQNMQ